MKSLLSIADAEPAFTVPVHALDEKDLIGDGVL
jgi:hypothetical protein